MTSVATRQLVHLVVALVALGGAISLALTVSPHWDEGFGDLRLLALSLGALVLVNIFPITFEWRGEAEDVSVEETFFVILVMRSPAAAAVVAMLFATVFGNLYRRRPPIKFIFNVGLFSLALSAALTVTRVVAGDIPTSSHWRSVAGAAAGAVTSHLCTTLGVRLIVSVADRLPFSRLFSSMSTLEVMLITSSVSLGALVGLAAGAQVLALILVIPPIVVIGIVLHQHARAVRDRQNLDRLLETAVKANQATGAHGVRQVVIDAASEMLHTQGVGIQVEEPATDELRSQIETDSGALWLVAQPHARRSAVTREDQAVLDGIAAIGSGALASAELLDRVRHQAFHDSLTGLPNRLLFEDRVDQALRSRDAKAVAVLFVDIDRFKRVNDSLGHRAGDDLLRGVAERLRLSLRAADSAARVGGDELVVLLPTIESEDEALEVARRISSELREPFLIDGKEVVITVSIGVAMAPADGNDYESLLRSADLAMYEAKATGRDAVRRLPGGAASSGGLALESELRHAIRYGGLWVAYQPQIELATMDIVGCEALVRWRHPVRGLMRPDEFLPLADDLGLLGDIDAFVLATACRQVAEWRRAGAADLRLAVNVSSSHLRSGTVLEMVTTVLAETGLPAVALELEVTEKVAATEGDACLESLSRLRGLGARVAIDDFGTGYSSLSRLRTLPADVLKIDQSFIREIVDVSTPVPLVASTIAMAQGLGLEVVAEGVETYVQMQFLQERGCRLAQGYLLGRPVNAEEFGARLLGRAAKSRAMPLLYG